MTQTGALSAHAGGELGSPGGPPSRVDRLVVHQLDLAKPAPGGIDTCVRGLVRHAPPGVVFAIVGVDAGADVPGRRLGVWERHDIDGRIAWFLPVTRLDAGNQRRRVPHSVRLVAGLLRYRRRLPDSELLQAHRADVAAAARLVVRRPLAYMVHTQQTGLTGATSDSMWRRAAGVHARIEHRLIRSARSVTVFNPDFAATAARINPVARFSPTWFEPSLSEFHAEAEQPYQVLWVGRVEEPKDPELAVRVLTELVRIDPGSPWRLHIAGAGTLLETLRTVRAGLEPELRDRVELLGRLTPDQVAREMSTSGVFLMTSHPGYEGFPRVLLEAMSAGLPAVVTQGSDTGGVIVPGRTGEVGDRDPEHLARAIVRSRGYDRRAVRDSVEQYSAPRVVAGILGEPTG